MRKLYSETFKSLPIGKQRLIIVGAIPFTPLLGVIGVIISRVFFDSYHISDRELLIELIFSGLLMYVLCVFLWLWIQDGKIQDRNEKYRKDDKYV